MIWLCAFSLSLCALFAVALLFDIVPMCRRFVGRIGVGRWESETAWSAALLEKNRKWLLKTPAVKVSDNERLTVIERLRGTYKNTKLQSWQEAALLLGINAHNGESDAHNAEKAFVERKLTSDGEWKTPPVSVDFALLAYAVLSSPDTQPLMVKKAMDSVYTLLQSSTKDGTVFYNGSIPDVRFADTVGMVCPFLFLYDEKYGCPEASLLAQRQIEEYIKRAMHSELFVPVHCFNVRTGAPMGVYGWGRGCGWIALGLGESLKCVTDSKVRQRLTEISCRYADALLVWQMQNGAWDRQIFTKGGGESSATAMIGTLMENLYGVCGEEKYGKSAARAREYLKSVTRRDGSVDCAQGDTKGIGFYSLRLDTLPAAQGFSAMLVKSEIKSE